MSPRSNGIVAVTLLMTALLLALNWEPPSFIASTDATSLPIVTRVSPVADAVVCKPCPSCSAVAAAAVPSISAPASIAPCNCETEVAAAVSSAAIKAAASLVTALAAAAATPTAIPRATTPDPRSPWVTRQLCHQLDDDSEACTYDGPLCIADDGAVAMGVEVPPVPSDASGGADAWRRAWKLGVREGRGSGPVDHRTFDYISHRNTPRIHDDGGERMIAPAFSGGDVRAGDVLPFSTLPVEGRQFGPLGGRGRVIQMPAAHLAAATTEADAAGLGGAWAESWAKQAAAAEPPSRWMLPKQDANLENALPPDSITWLKGGLYVSDICTTCFVHPWHAAIAWGNLWALRRMNATGREADVAPPLKGSEWGRDGAAGGDTSGGLSPPGLAYTSASGIAFPPMDTLYVRGSSQVTPYTNSSNLSPWNAELLRLWIPASATVMFRDDLRAVRTRGMALRQQPAAGAGSPPPPLPNHWVCAARGVIVGEKAGVFTGPRDAHAFRLAAYARAGVDTRTAWRPRAPHTITLVQRPKSRRFTNGADLEALLRATGLPVRVVADPGALSWADQVALFAGTGILVAAHGGVLANIMFLPVHAAVIEVFPYPLGMGVYGKLSAACRVSHYTVKGLTRPSQAAFAQMEYKQVNGSAFINTCDAPPPQASSSSSTAGNVGGPHYSTADISLQSACNPYAKLSDVEVPLGRFAVALEAALDDIGCRDSVCRVDGEGALQAEFVAMRQGGGRTGRRLTAPEEPERTLQERRAARTRRRDRMAR